MSGSARIRVPSPNSGWNREVVKFALSYNGYDRHGGFEGAAEIGNRLLTSWESSRVVEGNLADLRCALFFEQRRAHHADEPPDPDYLAALLEAIQLKSGGWVDGPADSLP